MRGDGGASCILRPTDCIGPAGVSLPDRDDLVVVRDEMPEPLACLLAGPVALWENLEPAHSGLTTPTTLPQGTGIPAHRIVLLPPIVSAAALVDANVVRHAAIAPVEDQEVAGVDRVL